MCCRHHVSCLIMRIPIVGNHHDMKWTSLYQPSSLLNFYSSLPPPPPKKKKSFVPLRLSFYTSPTTICHVYRFFYPVLYFGYFIREKMVHVIGCDWWSIEWRTHIGIEDFYSPISIDKFHMYPMVHQLC